VSFYYLRGQIHKLHNVYCNSDSIDELITYIRRQSQHKEPVFVLFTAASSEWMG